VGAMDPHQARLGSTLHARTFLAHLLGGSQHPHPAAGHEALAACFKDLQPAVLVAVPKGSADNRNLVPAGACLLLQSGT
jgi:hypothetical protein